MKQLLNECNGKSVQTKLLGQQRKTAGMAGGNGSQGKASRASMPVELDKYYEPYVIKLSVNTRRCCLGCLSTEQGALLIAFAELFLLGALCLLHEWWYVHMKGCAGCFVTFGVES